MMTIAPDRWRPLRLDGKVTAKLWCPKCERPGLLDEHEIDEGGNVSPSVVCGWPGCDFHEGGVTLAGWPPIMP